MSGATLSNIAFLSLALSANGIYEIKGAINFECGTSGGFAFGLSLPALAAPGSFVRMDCQSAAATQANTGAGIPYGFANFSAIAAGNTAVVSVSVATINVMRTVMIEGFLYVSANGTAQIMAKSSVAGASMSVRGGYIMSRKLGTF
jgi:hypothetical protein